MKSRATNEWSVEEVINSLGRNTSFKGEVYYFSIVMTEENHMRVLSLQSQRIRLHDGGTKAW